jgi:hypothetical protein
MRYIAAALFFLLLIPCIAQNEAFDPSAPHFTEAEMAQWFANQVKGATFVSRNGKMYGMDSDALITFAKDKQVEVTEFGYAPQTYKGTCTVDASGAIHVELRDYRAKWPDMHLYQNAHGTFLFPTDKNPAFRSAQGGVQTSKMAPYWPFRRTK